MRQAAAAYLQAGQFTTRQSMGRLVPEREFHEVPALPSRIRLLPGDLALGRGAPPAEVRAAYEAALNEKPSPPAMRAARWHCSPRSGRGRAPGTNRGDRG